MAAVAVKCFFVHEQVLMMFACARLCFPSFLFSSPLSLRIADYVSVSLSLFFTLSICALLVFLFHFLCSFRLSPLSLSLSLYFLLLQRYLLVCVGARLDAWTRSQWATPPQKMKQETLDKRGGGKGRRGAPAGGSGG